MTPEQIIEALHNKCGDALRASFVDAKHGELLARSLDFSYDLEKWTAALQEREESILFSNATHEYTLALLSVCQGQYRNAFKGLRLILELCLQGSYLSANIIELREWLRNERHTNWAALTDSNIGLFSPRFSKTFFREITDHVKNINTIAQTLYTELSECIHGNIPKKVPLQDSIEFNANILLVWNEKCVTTRMLIQFAFCMRYLLELPDDSKSTLEASILEQLGHIEAIRVAVGGAKTS